MKNYIYSIIISTMYILPAVSMADYGEAFISINCDKIDKIFEVEPLIIWNEDLDDIQEDLKKGNGKILDGNIELIKIIPNSKIESTCKLANNILRISTSNYWKKIELYKNNKLVVSPQVGYVWDFSGLIFKIRYTESKGWEELCERLIDDAEKWKPLDTTRKDTNCKK